MVARKVPKRFSKPEGPLHSEIMAPQSLYRLVIMCLVFLAISFSFFFVFNELPKRVGRHSMTTNGLGESKFSSPPIERVPATITITHGEDSPLVGAGDLSVTAGNH